MQSGTSDCQILAQNFMETIFYNIYIGIALGISIGINLGLGIRVGIANKYRYKYRCRYRYIYKSRASYSYMYRYLKKWYNNSKAVQNIALSKLPYLCSIPYTIYTLQLYKREYEYVSIFLYM